MNDIDLAWAAGIVDGEGCLYIAVRKEKSWMRFDTQLTVANTNPKILLRFKELFGGFIYPGTMPRSLRERQSWVWKPGGGRASYSVVRMLFPYLVGKRDEAELFLCFCMRCSKRYGNKLTPECERKERIAMVKQMHDLKRAAYVM